ncbi:MAG: M56 family metallopeptidase [Planctomycetota bacterium]|jgi:beta-lactamase regulating signal transducer with metallopeptidase domain
MILELFPEDLSLWNVAWQSTLFVVIGLVGSFLLRRRPARASQVLFLAIIAAILLPVMSVLVRHYGLGLFIEKPIVLPSVELEIPADTPEIVFSTEIQPATLEVPTGITIAEKSSWDLKIPWRIVALYGWMVAALIMLGRLIIAFVSGIRLLHRARSNRCEHIRSAADSARARLGITKGLKIRSSKNVRSPIIWCWNRPPVLLVPADLDDRIDWVDVICHELAHWRRWDHISGLIAELAVCILPWNPLLWWSKKRMLRLSEQACDDWVLAGGCAGTDYAQSLLNLSPELQMAFMPTVIGKEKPMKKRIYRIVKEKCGIPQVGSRWALVVTMIAASLTVGVALAQRRPARFEQLERDERIVAEERERHALAEHRVNLEHRVQELKARLDQVKMELAELEESGKGEGERARALRVELREMEEAMVRLERELHERESQRRKHEMQLWNIHEPRNEILRRLEELSRETEFLLQGLADQRIGRNDETNILYNRMRELNEQMRQVRQQLGRQLQSPDRRRRELDRERGIDSRARGAGRQVHPEAMMLEREELKEKARQIELELEELGDEDPDRAEKLHVELREIHGAIVQIEHDVTSLRNRENIHQAHQRELQNHARQLEHRLQELGDGHPEEAQELRMQLDKIHQRMQMSRRELGLPERPWPRDEDPMQPIGELHRQKLIVQQEQIQAQMRELEHVLRELNEQGEAESEEARLHQRELRDIQKLLQETENELRKSVPGRARERGQEDLEREVQSLRKQMDGMNEQMGEMRELMKRLLEKKETQEAL